MEHPVLSWFTEHSLDTYSIFRTRLSVRVFSKKSAGLGSRRVFSRGAHIHGRKRTHVFGYAQIKNLFVFFSPFISDSPAFHLLISFSVFKSECFPSLFVSASACSHLLPRPSQPFILCLLFFCGFSFMSIKLAFLFSNLPAVVSYICHFCQTVPHVNIIQSVWNKLSLHVTNHQQLCISC